MNATGDQTNTDPKLGPLQDNGGPTFTQALLCDSPAIDKGKNLSGCPTSQNFAGTINNTDPTKNSTLGPAAGSCGGNTCPGIAGGAFHYDAYTLVNPSGSAQCFTVTLDGSGCGGNTLWSNAYLGTVDPANGCTNFLGNGNTVVPANPYSFSVPGGGTFVVTVEEFNPNSGCGNYSMSVSGFSCVSLTDQRGTGFARTFDDPAKTPATGGDNTDIGAFEAQSPVPSCNQPPVAKCKNVTVSAGANCSANASIDNGSYDPDAGDTVTLSQSPAGPYPLGTTNVTLTVTDSHGASSMCSSNVTVQDTTPPVITLNGANPMTVQCHSTFTDPGATASDNCGGNLTSSIIRTGSVNTSSPGMYILTYDVQDPSGNNAATVARTVNVVDTMGPVITSISASPNVLTPANHKLRPVTVKVTATDACDPHPVSKIISVANSEHDTDPEDYQITGNLTVKLEAEVDGKKLKTRTYTITVRCKDASGNASTKTTTVVVKK